MAVESAKVREKWFVFQENCPKEERLDLQNTEPTVECVTNLVNEKIRAWQSKREMGRRGKAMSFFHRFCGTLDSHSSLLKLLPEGSHYASIFTGTLHAIIKVCRRSVPEYLKSPNLLRRRLALTTSELQKGCPKHYG